MSSVTVKVKCGKPKTKIVKEGEIVMLDVKARPIKGEANQEIVKFFSKKTGKKVKIIKGLKSSVKVLKIE